MSLRDLYWAARDLFVRPRTEPWSPADEERWRRELEEEPIGREGALWSGNPDVRPEDRHAWQWLETEDEKERLAEWADHVEGELPRLPPGSMLYDLASGLRLHDDDGTLRKRVEELHSSTLAALRQATSPGEWIYAIEEPEESYYRSYRFWPHRATDTTTWYASPVPDGDNQFFVSQDFDWGLLALFGGGFGHVEWQLCVFGQPLLGAFAKSPPRAFSTRLEGDAFSQGDRDEQTRESKTGELMFKVSLNCQLARDHGLWTRDLERRYRKLQRLEQDPAASTPDFQKVLAGLIARVELVLADSGVEYESAMSHFHE